MSAKVDIPGARTFSFGISFIFFRYAFECVKARCGGEDTHLVKGADFHRTRFCSSLIYDSCVREVSTPSINDLAFFLLGHLQKMR
jgi:hypothetical protein